MFYILSMTKILILRQKSKQIGTENEKYIIDGIQKQMF